MSMSLYYPAIAEIFLAGMSILFVLVAAFGGEDRKAASLMRKLTIASFVVAGLLIASYGHMPNLAFGALFVTSPFMVFMKLLVLAGAGIILLLAQNQVSSDRMDRPEFPLLVLLSVLGMLVLISANDLMVLYMGIELQSLPLYVIAAMQRDSIRSSEAGLKYFLWSVVLGLVALWRVIDLWLYRINQLRRNCRGVEWRCKRGCGDRDCFLGGRNGVQDFCGTVPYVDARCL